ncbi:Di-copper centre-containing protein [Thozetella sp. PMI_491]|nr:Di-copper centre-containing protein [Thozetella sp. PMI_491]
MARLLSVLLLAVPWLLLSSLVSADVVLDLQKKGRPNVDAQLAKSTTCTKEKLQVRQEWGDLNNSTKKAYIAAMLCLMAKPSKLDQKKYPGAKSRYDDFVAVHMNQTMQGNFLSWHRYYLWSFEQALRNECGYTGAQPYWDWGRWAQDPEKSPIFDGSDTSLSGNGEKITHKSNGFSPAGNGGGCVKTGPFKNMTVHLGPVSPAADPAPPRNPMSTGFGDNPRCLRRDMSNYLTSRYTRPQDIASLITQSKTIASFQDTMQNASPNGGMGVHSSGHYTIAGDPGGDTYTSPNDPAFWVHHGMIDRTWAIWQSQDPSTRTNVIAGGTTMMGFGSKAQKLEDPVDIGVGAPEIAKKVWAIQDLTSTVSGPFCYVYE